MVSPLVLLTFLLNVVFRLFSIILLQVIPAKQAEYGIPLLFTTYLILHFLIRPGYTLVEETVTEVISVDVQEKPAANGDNRSYAEAVKEVEPAKRTDADIVVTDEVTDVVEVQKIPPFPLQLGKPTLFKALIGWPTNSRLFNRVPFLVNCVLFLMCMDFLFTPFVFDQKELAFDRIASVTDTSAKIVIRHPPDEEPSTITSATYLSYRQAPPHAGPWLKGPQTTFSESDDWTSTFEIGFLLPSTEYEYISPSNPMKVSSFRTAPDPTITRNSGTHFTFLSTSCIKPNFPYSLWGPRNRIPGLKRLADWLDGLEEGKKVSFMLFLGDFVYADTPISGLWKSFTGEWYRSLYRQVYSSQDAKDVYSRVPILNIPDDHEFINNYAGDGETSSLFVEASTAYRIYNGDGNPKSTYAASSQVLYYDYAYGDTAFFVLDTRQFRSPETMVDGSDKTMLGDVQKEALFHWLGKVNQTSTFKFVVSSVPFNSLWAGPDGQQDTWAGYRTERDEILSVLEYVPNVIVLSGDRHEFAAVSLRNKVLEFSTSPLSQFYVPYIKTLKQELSKKVETAPKSTTAAGTEEEDAVEDALEEVEVMYEEKIMKYITEGNSKWSSFEVDTRNRSSPFVQMTLYIDGERSWDLKILGEPVLLPQKAMKLGGGLIGILEFLGLSPLKWF